MPLFLPATAPPVCRVMIFVDGENLAIRYKSVLGEHQPKNHISYIPDVMVWSPFASRINGPQHYIRRHYYTCTHGDQKNIEDIENKLIKIGVECPRVFHKSRNRRSKRVDITLATDMLGHAHRKNYDIAVLVAGDEDYVPLVEAVKNEGRQVALWAIESGLSPALKKACDHFFDIGKILFHEEDPAFREIYY